MAAVLSLIGTGFWQRPAGVENHLPEAHERLLELVTRPDVQRVGQMMWPALGYPTLETLAEHLSACLAAAADRPLSAGSSLVGLHQAFEKAVRSDFAAGRCMQVGGWVLARIEVELCALAALNSRRA